MILPDCVFFTFAVYEKKVKSRWKMQEQQQFERVQYNGQETTNAAFV